MFFLKELPTQAMINRYSEDYFPERSEDVAKKLQGLREYSTLIRKLEDYFASHNLSQLRFLVMMVIDREPDRDHLLAHEITERLDVSKPVLSRAIKKLIAASLLSSKKDKQDARAVLLSLTPTSKELLRSILPGYFDILSAQSHSV
ncbi:MULTISPECIES: MarR family winged helix-turn-helix transcriptional regulator [Alteromonadaceae]|uniref:MarR family winged helix-turn-helix transcriptional regulator n=1 Tax=Alteromonadaceae TaxID=72275 RepID=UPI001C08253D|nr:MULTISPECIES: MarR family transcriptional regulator [Aliiglaciecola]MBU2876178.1 MarR family transcriptional regulator [Aliiglaciecola lipolytica]MDO6710394.1 MarR family transcriptional regulator [Aliiglaciecola sp. 2_MG-2023]MDO6751741.1 MarR family transcriptional regulator [Aliiglaciecola sp. 1_MG-2023]